MTDQQNKLLEFVKEQHGSQVRKYTNEPYWTHPLSVARIAEKYLNDDYPFFFEIALCHDLFEDTTCDYHKLFAFLNFDCRYGTEAARFICNNVSELTDEYTSERYPLLNRRKRKEAEAIRLGFIGQIAQSIKYADLIDNCNTIVKFDPSFASTYLKEKKDILNKMRAGNIDLFIRCCHVWSEATELLNTKTPIEA